MGIADGSGLPHRFEGPLTIENTSTVTSLIRELLTGRTFTVVCSPVGGSEASREEGMQLEEGVQEAGNGFHIHVSNCTYPVTTILHDGEDDPNNENPYIRLTDNRVFIQLRSDEGQEHTWEFILE